MGAHFYTPLDGLLNLIVNVYCLECCLPWPKIYVPMCFSSLNIVSRLEVFPLISNNFGIKQINPVSSDVK